MAKNTILRVIKGHVGTTELGGTFDADQAGLGPVDIQRLLRLKVVEIASGEAPKAPVAGYTAEEKAEIDASIERMVEGYESLQSDLKAAGEEIETLKAQAELTTSRSNEIANESVAARASIVRALSAVGQQYDSSASTPALANAMAESVEAYVRKKTEDILKERMLADAGKQPPIVDETLPKPLPAANGAPLTEEPTK